MYKRIRKAREDLGYTREKFAELLDVSVSYMAEVERGRTGISVKMLMKICNVLGLSADYVLFGDERGQDALLLDRIKRLDSKYLPLLNDMLSDLLTLNDSGDGECSPGSRAEQA
jgi:transcriptional regulator with XRE-family HTH domain